MCLFAVKWLFGVLSSCYYIQVLQEEQIRLIGDRGWRPETPHLGMNDMRIHADALNIDPSHALQSSAIYSHSLFHVVCNTLSGHHRHRHQSSFCFLFFYIFSFFLFIDLIALNLTFLFPLFSSKITIAIPPYISPLPWLSSPTPPPHPPETLYLRMNRSRRPRRWSGIRRWCFEEGSLHLYLETRVVE